MWFFPSTLLEIRCDCGAAKRGEILKAAMLKHGDALITSKGLLDRAITYLHPADKVSA
jgi:hypothetical protein